jgi:hypothetical protein
MNGCRSVVVASLVVCGGWQASAQQPARSTDVLRPAVRPLSRDALLGTIQGNALTSSNGQLANAAVRLRNARFGGIVDSQLTDHSGLFSFKSIDPGSYIVEMIGSDHTVLAASQVLHVNAGEAASAVVKLPFRISPYASVLGHTTTSATAVTTEAAASSVLSVQSTGTASCDLAGGPVR